MKNIIWLSLVLGFLSLGNLNTVIASDESAAAEVKKDGEQPAGKKRKRDDSKENEKTAKDEKVATNHFFKAIQFYKLTNGMKDTKCEATSIKIDGQDIALPAEEDVKKICALSVCSLLKSSLTDKKEMKEFNKAFKLATKTLCPRKNKSEDDVGEAAPEGFSTECWNEMVLNKDEDHKKCEKAMKALIEDPKKSKDKHDKHSKKAKKPKAQAVDESDDK